MTFLCAFSVDGGLRRRLRRDDKEEQKEERIASISRLRERVRESSI